MSITRTEVIQVRISRLSRRSLRRIIDKDTMTDNFKVEVREVTKIKTQEKLYWSNCFIEAIKAKVKYRSEIRLIHLPARENEIYCPHWMWHDLRDDNVYDFHAPPPFNEDHWWNFIIFKGYIRVRPYSVRKKRLGKSER